MSAVATMSDIMYKPAATAWMPRTSENIPDDLTPFLALTERHWTIPRTIHLAIWDNGAIRSLVEDMCDITDITVAVAQLNGHGVV